MTDDQLATVQGVAPRWFRRALQVPIETASTVVDGATINYLGWGTSGRRGLVFVHGGGAHAHWWTHIAASFAEDFRVLALDLSGHGDSDHRRAYSLEQWTAEVVEVAAHGGITGRPVLVGHSMGGFVTIATAARHGEQLDGVIVCDSPVSELDHEITTQGGEAFGTGARVYKSLEEAVSRYRTVPPQEHYLDFVMDYVARQSLRVTPDGWVWKFDRRIFEQFAGELRFVALPYLRQVGCRFALLRSEYGLVTPDIGATMYEALGRRAPVIELPEAGHHAMLDQPLVLITALRTLLADWDHSNPLAQPTGP
ncbi:MAG: alpha/beta fold hydrolase [Acidimicrobiales bacterium]